MRLLAFIAMLTRILVCLLIAVVAFGGLRAFEIRTQRNTNRANVKRRSNEEPKAGGVEHKADAD